MLVELLDENGNFIREVNRYFVTSQGEFEQIGNANEETIDFGDECTQSGFLRFSLVNEHERQPAYFDAFEIVHKPNTEKLTVTSWTDYYPFGKVAKTACSGAGAYRYGYQGEFAEKDNETDWNSFELRQYDSDVARWLSVDPYGQYWSPYMAMGNDPVNQVDADGGWSGGDFSKMSQTISQMIAFSKPQTEIGGSSGVSSFIEAKPLPPPPPTLSQEKFGVFLQGMSQKITSAGNTDKGDTKIGGGYDGTLSFVDNYFQCSTVSNFLFGYYANQQKFATTIRSGSKIANTAKWADFVAKFEYIGSFDLYTYNAYEITADEVKAGDLIVKITDPRHVQIIYAVHKKDGIIKLHYITASGHGVPTSVTSHK